MLTLENIKQKMRALADRLSCESVYYQFLDNVTRDRFLVWYFDNSDDLHADGINYFKIRDLVIEFYSSVKDFDSEKIIEDFFTEEGVAFDTNGAAYVKEEALYQTTYYLEVTE